jgi:hypothetical protein
MRLLEDRYFLAKPGGAGFLVEIRFGRDLSDGHGGNSFKGS